MDPTSGAHKVRSDRTGPPQCLLHRPLPRLALVLSVPASGQPFASSCMIMMTPCFQPLVPKVPVASMVAVSGSRLAVNA